MQWPFLDTSVQEGLLEPIDLIFAERLLAQSDCVLEEVGAFLALLMRSFAEGHLCFDIETAKDDPSLRQLINLARQGRDQIPSDIHQILEGNELMPLKPICVYDGDVYFQKNWVFETQFLQQVHRLLKAKPSLSFGIKPISAELNLEQRKAVELSISSSLSLIIGGPGTGKTFTAKCLVKECLDRLSPEDRKHFRIILAAPTGKAVVHLEKQIRSSLDEEDQRLLGSGTLHALLQLREDGSQQTESLLFADLIIVDECSMIDARLYALLLLAIPSGTCLVLIGDKDQLPAIDAGSFFADLIDAGCPAVTLKQSRRVENDQLAALAEAVRSGKISDTMRAFYPFIEQYDESLQSRLFSLLHASCPSFFMSEPDPQSLLVQMDRFRILSCLRQGPFGVDAVNCLMLHSFQSLLPEEGWWAIPILITRNDSSSKLYNGETGVLLKKIHSIHRHLKWGGEDYALFPNRKPIPALALPPFEYAYCLSVHKSQGSEYDSISLLVPEGSERFGKEILYTALTRARKECRIYGQKETIEKMLQKTCRKRSGLLKRLCIE